MRVVIALGGHALSPVEGAGPEDQRRAVRAAVDAIAHIAARHDVVVTHGNGPQVGLLAAQAAAAGDAPPSLDALGAESEGLIGYWIEQDLENALPGRDVAALLTQVEVQADDPAFGAPSKPIGPVVDEAGAERLRAAGYDVGPDRGGYRRLVASPLPRSIVEIRTIQLLLRLGTIVICGGGGGIPVVRDESGARRGAEAVIDKDRTAALLATEVGADRLLLLTDVPAVYADWPGRDEPIRRAPPHLLAPMEFDAGSMGPKVEAARHFVQGTGGVALVGKPEDAVAMLDGRAGTRVDGDARSLEVGA
ncbi:MAG: carbamate kinase [Myxococcota bacterium]